MYKTLIAPLLGVFFLLLGGVGETQAQWRMQRIDRKTQKTVFIPKGTWMVGDTVSYSEHNESNLNFLVLRDIERKGHDFSVSPYFGYFFRDNISTGARFAYKRDYLDLGNFDLNPGEDFNISLKNLYYLEHKYGASCFIRTYMPIDKSKIFGLFNEARLTYGCGTGKSSTGSDAEHDGSYQTVQNTQISLAPGMTTLITDWLTIEVSVGVMGFDFKWVDQETNKVEEGQRRISSGSFKINLPSVDIGMTFYL